MKMYKYCLILVTLTVFFSCKNDKGGMIPKRPIERDTVPALNPYAAMDQSPMDMSWCPANYPIEKMKGNDSMRLIARVTYSRPHKKGRSIFGKELNDVCVYGKPWRLGANEATEVNLFEPVNVAGQNLARGTYVLYCIPYEDHWTLILNSNLYTWGLHINAQKDLFRIDLPVLQQIPSLEDFTIAFEDSPTGANLVMAWDKVKTVLPVVFAR